MAALLCPLAVGQSVPAATSWQKHPSTAVSPPTPIPPPPPLTGTPPAPAAPGSRVVLFTKPAGEVQAVQASEARADVRPREDKKPEVQNAPRDPFVLRSDDDLAVELDALRDYPGMMKDYAKRQVEYARDMELYKRGELKDSEGKLKPEPTKPSKPQPANEYLLPPMRVQPGVQVKAGYAPVQALLEPGYVVHRRLFFEDKNAERYGWDLGFAQPFLSAGGFFTGVAFWPSKLTSNFAERYDTSAGKCPPGSPVAYYLYPPGITFRGGVVNAGLVVGSVLLMP